jgi:hypothetical protein
LDSRKGLAGTTVKLRINPVFAAIDLIQNCLGAQAQQIGKQVRVRLESESVRCQLLLSSQIGEHDSAGTVGNEDRLFQQIEKIRRYAEWQRVIRLYFNRWTTSQAALLRTLVSSPKADHSI